MNKIRFLIVCLTASGLVSCGSSQQSTQYTIYQPYIYQNTKFYPLRDEELENTHRDEERQRGIVSVPESYHVSAYHSPMPHKNIDRDWVNGQSPRGYTIEIAQSERAAVVAGQLYRVPKTDRMAEVKYYQNGRTYYRGVYGSYASFEDAQRAFNGLPPEIKQGAYIKNWSNIQENVRY